jgi:hypothetical protein
MKPLRILLVSALLAVPVPLLAQTVRGVVVEDATRVPIAGALVELVTPAGERLAAAQTTGDGAFQLRLRRPASFIVQLSHLAYATVHSDTISAAAGEVLTVEVRMDRTVIPLEPLVVTARRDSRLSGFYERQQRPGFGRFITREEIERQPAMYRTTDLLRMMPGVEIVRAGNAAVPVHLIAMRGGTGRCLPTIYLDGSIVRQFEFSGVDEMLSPSMIEGVEVYTGIGGAPASLAPRGNCGVVAFWTRSGERGRWSWKRLAAGVGVVGLMILLTR